MTPTLTLEPLTMQGAADFWKDKIILGPGEFKKLSDAAKIRAFSVSGIAKGDELTTVYKSLQRAIEKGISYSKFKKECAGIFERRGWTGKREWRIQNIFRTNIQTAYSIGRWQKQQEMADVFPYLQYSAVNDRRTRPTHKAVDDLVFPIDHPFWDNWYPPNGYRCRCSTLSLTKRQVERRGLEVETKDPTNTPVAIPNPVTGEKIHVQQLLPDPGFGMHPGKTWLQTIGDTTANRVEKWPDKIATQTLKTVLGGEGFRSWYAQPAGDWPVGKIKQSQAREIGATTSTVLLSEKTAIKQRQNYPDLSASEYRFVQETIDRGKQTRKGDRNIIFTLEENGYVSVLKSTKTGEGIFVTSFRRSVKADSWPGKSYATHVSKIAYASNTGKFKRVLNGVWEQSTDEHHLYS